MSNGPLRVLVVEDEATVAATLVQGMRAQGFAVYLATRGAEGVRLAFADPPDAIVLDLILPDCSGFDVLEEIQGRCTAPVVVLTGRLELGDRLRCFALGAADYVAKPFYFEELVARIRSRLRAREGVAPRVVSWADVSTTGTDAAARAWPRAGTFVSIDARCPPDSRARADVFKFVPAFAVTVPLTGWVACQKVPVTATEPLTVTPGVPVMPTFQVPCWATGRPAEAVTTWSTFAPGERVVA